MHYLHSLNCCQVWLIRFLGFYIFSPRSKFQNHLNLSYRREEQNKQKLSRIFSESPIFVLVKSLGLTRKKLVPTPRCQSNPRSSSCFMLVSISYPMVWTYLQTVLAPYYIPHKHNCITYFTCNQCTYSCQT